MRILFGDVPKGTALSKLDKNINQIKSLKKVNNYYHSAASERVREGITMLLSLSIFHFILTRGLAVYIY